MNYDEGMGSKKNLCDFSSESKHHHITSRK